MKQHNSSSTHRALSLLRTLARAIQSNMKSFQHNTNDATRRICMRNWLRMRYRSRRPMSV